MASTFLWTKRSSWTDEKNGGEIKSETNKTGVVLLSRPDGIAAVAGRAVRSELIMSLLCCYQDKGYEV